jgi:hypothetical protein
LNWTSSLVRRCFLQCHSSSVFFQRIRSVRILRLDSGIRLYVRSRRFGYTLRLWMLLNSPARRPSSSVFQSLKSDNCRVSGRMLDTLQFIPDAELEYPAIHPIGIKASFVLIYRGTVPGGFITALKLSSPVEDSQVRFLHVQLRTAPAALSHCDPSLMLPFGQGPTGSSGSGSNIMISHEFRSMPTSTGSLNVLHQQLLRVLLFGPGPTGPGSNITSSHGARSTCRRSPERSPASCHALRAASAAQ